MLVVGSETIYTVTLNEYDAIDEWSSTSQVIYSFEVFPLENFHILFTVGKNAHMS